MAENPWQAIDTEETIWRAQYEVKLAKPYSLLVRAAANRYLAYSPGPGLVESAKQLLPDNAELLLLAPAGGHTLGLESWREAFPDARVFASETAGKRILEHSAIDAVRSLEELSDALPDHITVHELPQNNFGEVWVSIESTESGGTLYWAVCDSLMNLQELSDRLLARLFMRLYGLGIGLRVHKLFRRGVKDKSAFRHWAAQRFPASRRNVLLPCHGEIYDADDLANRVRQLVESNF